MADRLSLLEHRVADLRYLIGELIKGNPDAFPFPERGERPEIDEQVDQIDKLLGSAKGMIHKLVNAIYVP